MTGRPHRSPSNRTKLLAAVAVGLPLVAAACGSSSNSGSGSSTTTKSAATTAAAAGGLAGTSWQLESAGDSAIQLSSAVTITASFDATTMSGNGGCNQYTGPYKVDGTKITIGPEVASTAKACDAPVMLVEKAYLAALPKVTSYAMTGGKLTLSAADGKALLTYAAGPGAAALEGNWDVLSYYSGNAITSVLNGTTMTAAFSGGQISGNTGCNSYNGPYTTSGDNITIGPLTSTRAACSSDALSKQESDYLAALGLAKAYKITGDRLDLLRDGGTIAATYQKAS